MLHVKYVFSVRLHPSIHFVPGDTQQRTQLHTCWHITDNLEIPVSLQWTSLDSGRNRCTLEKPPHFFHNAILSIQNEPLFMSYFLASFYTQTQAGILWWHKTGPAQVWTLMCVISMNPLLYTLNADNVMLPPVLGPSSKCSSYTRTRSDRGIIIFLKEATGTEEMCVKKSTDISRIRVWLLIASVV